MIYGILLSMRILFVADGRSPTTLNWLRYWVERGDEVFLVSTFPCKPDLKLAGLETISVAFSGTASETGNQSAEKRLLRGSRTLGLRVAIRRWLGPLTIRRSVGRLRGIIEAARPDLVHAMRIPFEGMLTADAVGSVPFIVSVWGNDFTLHAPSTPLMRHYTTWTMEIADALHADCRRDVRLARQWGFQTGRPTLVVPGNGGIRTDVFCPPAEPVRKPVVVNPRGFRGYVRNDTFFQSIPLVLKKYPDALFRCASMARQVQALDWVTRLGIEKSVELLPSMSHNEMAGVFQTAQVVVSPSIHDGTPNSLLEGMACGCFPVAGDLESLREWITPGSNGLLVDPADPQALADAITTAFGDPILREKAGKQNASIIATRAEYRRCMEMVETFYRKLL
jgi:hypothetical protein